MFELTIADVLNIIKEKVFFLLFNKSFLKPSFAVWDLGRLAECVTLHLFLVIRKGAFFFLIVLESEAFVEFILLSLLSSFC